MITDKRIDEIVKHLIGTRLSLNSVLTARERDNVEVCRVVLSKVKMNGDTMKWEENVVT